MGVIDDSNLDGAIVMQRIADANSFEAIKRASILGQQEGFDTGVEKDDGYGLGSYYLDSYLNLGPVEYFRNKADKSAQIAVDLHDAAQKYFLSKGQTDLAKVLDVGTIGSFFAFNAAQQPIGHVDGEDPIATQEWIAGEFERAQPNSRGAMVQLF